MYRTRLRGVAERAIVESPSLRMSKFAQIPVKGQDPDDAKKDEVNEIVKTANRFQLVPGLDPFMDLPDSRTFTTKLCSRLIVNSAGGVLENAGLSLHRNLGYPFIPGSAVKGVARHAAWCEWHDADEADRERIARSIAAVFGYPTNDRSDDGLDDYLAQKCGELPHAGAVCFFGAIPMGRARLETDILNVHHREYYGMGRKVATDDENPTLCYFPVVAADSEFRFTVKRVRRSLSDEDFKKAEMWLKTALSLHGIGAKTSAGYGWFDVDAEDYDAIAPDEGLLARWQTEYPSATKQKKEFVKGDWFTDPDPVVQRSALEFVIRQEWWSREKRNSGSRIVEKVTGLAGKFGLEV